MSINILEFDGSELAMLLVPTTLAVAPATFAREFMHACSPPLPAYQDHRSNCKEYCSMIEISPCGKTSRTPPSFASSSQIKVTCTIVVNSRKFVSVPTAVRHSDGASRWGKASKPKLKRKFRSGQASFPKA